MSVLTSLRPSRANLTNRLRRFGRRKEIHPRPASKAITVKRLFIPLLLLVSVALHAQPTRGRFWTDEQRKFLVDQLENSQRELLTQVQNLSEAQLYFRADTTQWSVAQVLEHLAVQEEHLHWDLLYNQYTPEQPKLARKGRREDREFLAYATDAAKGEAPWLALPLGRFQSRDELLAYFSRFRNQVIRHVTETPTDFRVHFIYRPKEAGIWHRVDLHQYTLGFVAHTQRHTSQIRQIKADPRFPRPDPDKQ
jgi:hypothetical protein